MSSSVAQSDTTQTKGEIVSGEIVIEKDKKITLPQADKIYLRSSINSFNDEPLNQTFESIEPSMQWPSYKSDVPFKQVTFDLPNADYQNFVRLGYGNYQSWLIESGFYSKMGSWNTYANVFYEDFQSGPVFDANSGNSIGKLNLSSVYRGENFSIKPLISYQGKTYNYFGNTNRINAGFDSADPDQGRLNSVNFSTEITLDKDDFSMEVKPKLSITNQKIGEIGENREFMVGAIGQLDYGVNESFSAGLNFDVTSAAYDGGLSYNRSIINMNPWVKRASDDLAVTVGFMLSIGSFDANSKSGFYPMINAELTISDDWNVYGLVEGGQSWNGFADIANDNQFLDDSLLISNTEVVYKFGGGIKGRPFKNFVLDLSITHESLNGLPFFIPSASDSSRYTLTYDLQEVNLTRLTANASYIPSNVSVYGASLELNGYTVETLEKPWHKPAFIFKAYTSHSLNQKVLLSSGLTFLGGLRSPADADFGYVRLDSFLDIAFSAKYLITSRASAFIEINNLLNNEYERYLGYPTRGLAFKIGGQYRF